MVIYTFLLEPVRMDSPSGRTTGRIKHELKFRIYSNSSLALHSFSSS